MKPAEKTPRPRRFKKRFIAFWIFLLLILALLVARLYLPIYLKDYVNAQLNHMKGYRGSVEDIGVALYRGSYQIKGLELNKIDKGIPVPFMRIALTDISLQWGALLHGRIVSDVHFTRPQLNFAVSKNGVTKQTGTDANWQTLVKNLVPIDINLVEIIDGKITYKDFSANPQVDLYINDLDAKLTNMRNVVDKGNPLPSTINLTGNSIGKGKLGLKGRMNVLAKRWIDMNVDGRLESTQLVAFNNFSEACCALKFKRGMLDVYTELAINDGNITGYVKPLVHDLSVDRIPKDSNPLEMAWAAAASVVIEIFTNHSKDQFATKVPISGSLDKIDTSIWPTIGGVLRNAFVEAFSKGTDQEISFGKKANGSTGIKVTDEKKPAAAKPAKTEAIRSFPGSGNDHPTRR